MTRRVDTVVLDKTGTVTSGQMTPVDVVGGEGEDADEVLRLTGAIEAASEHPVAQAIATGATDRVGPLPAVTGFTSGEGLGVTGNAGGRTVTIERDGFVADRALPPGSGAGEARRRRSRAYPLPEFERRWRAGEFCDIDYPRVTSVAMLPR